MGDSDILQIEDSFDLGRMRNDIFYISVEKEIEARFSGHLTDIIQGRDAGNDTLLFKINNILSVDVSLPASDVA